MRRWFWLLQKSLANLHLSLHSICDGRPWRRPVHVVDPYQNIACAQVLDVGLGVSTDHDAMGAAFTIQYWGDAGFNMVHVVAYQQATVNEIITTHINACIPGTGNAIVGNHCALAVIELNTAVRVVQSDIVV